MTKFPIGVIAESFRLPLPQALQRAKALGLDGVQFYAATLDALVDKATRRAFRKHCDGLRLTISALVRDLGKRGIRETGASARERVEIAARAIDLASDMGVGIVTGHIGVVPVKKKARASYSAAVRMMREIARRAAARKVVYGIETGPETAVCLADFLVDVGAKGLGVNLDPANLAMVTGDDPARAVEALGSWIVHTHAKDGVRYQDCDAETVYESFASGGFDALVKKMGKLFDETPLGKGAVDWPAYLAALAKVGYRGFLTIEREVGDKPEKDIAAAARFLRKLCRARR